MVKVELKYITVTAKGRHYYYPWRPERGIDTPRLPGVPGSPEFNAVLIDAHQNRHMPDTGRARSLVTVYKASPDYKNLADSTKRQWAPWLDRIAEHFGDLSVKQFDRPEKIRPHIRRWRNQWADTPRTADYGMQVLSRVLSYAVDPLGKIAGNPCEGIKQLYSADRSEIIWTDIDIQTLTKACPPEVAHAVALAAHTGLRLSDVLRLSWSHVGDDAITFATGKSRGRREALIPLYDGLRKVLASIPRRSPIILTNQRRRPWKKDGFSTAFNRAKKRAGLSDRDLHFHDLRGSAATKFYIAKLPIRVIAEILAWDEETVERIIRRYVGRTAATRAIIDQMNKAEPGT